MGRTRQFKPGDICIVIDGYYKGMTVEVKGFFGAKVHVSAKYELPYTYFIPEELLELEAVVKSPLYKALS